MAVRKLTLVLDMNSGSFSTRIVDATGKLKTFDAQVARTNAAMGRATKATNEFGRAARDIHHSLSFIHVVMLALTTTVGGFTMGLVKMNAEAQRSLALLEGLSEKGTAAARKLDAAANFKFLRDFSKTAPYSLDALTDTFVKLKSVGIDPTKGAMQALIDGVANFGGSNSELHRAAVAIQQMSGKGVISMEELRQQLGEAMPTALRIMAKAAGMSVGDFVDQVSKGKVAAEGLIGTTGKFWAELQRENAGAAARLMETFLGQTQKMKSNIYDLALAVGGLNSDGTFMTGGFMDTLIGQTKDLNTWLADPATIEGARQFGRSLAELLTSVSEIVQFVSANHQWFIFLGTAFAVSKGVELSTAALRTMLGAIGLNVEANGKLASSSALLRLRELEYHKAVATGRAVTLGSVQANAMKAKQAVINAQNEIAAITATNNALKAEAAQRANNIALLEAEAAAARNAAMAQRGNTAAGFSNVVVGAGANSRPMNGTGAIQAARLLKAEQEALAKTNAALAASETALAGASARLTIAQRAATAATAAATVGARAATVAMRGLSFVMSMLGGPIIGTILIAVTALTMAFSYYNENLSDTAIQQKAVEKAIAETTPITDDYTTAMMQATVAGDQLNESQIRIAESAIWAGQKQIEAAQDAVAAAEANLAAARMNTQAAAEMNLNMGLGMTGASGVASYAFTEGAEQRKVKKAEAEIRALQEEYVKKGMARWVYDPNTPGGAFVWNNPREDAEKQLKELQDRLAAAKAGSSSGSSGGRSRLSPAQNLEGDIAELIASQQSLTSLLDTLDEGSQAAEKMRARIAEMRAEGKSISPDLEARAVEAARQTANIEQAYRNLESIISGARENSGEFHDALIDLGSGTDKVDASARKFANTLQIMRDQIIAADPELATDIERVKKLDSIIAQSRADQRFIAIAGSVASLTAELDKMARENLNPGGEGWNEWANQIAEIELQLANVKRLRDEIAGMAEGPEKEERKRAADELEKKALDNRARYTDEWLRRQEFSLEQEIRANEEALLTQDEARQRAFEREIERIEALTDVSKLSAEERAKHEARLLELRERAIEAAKRRHERDSESPMRKMVREYEDTTARLKELQGEWLRDAMEKFKAGELSFGDMVVKIIEDYLWMIAQAKMASMVEAGIDGLFKLAGDFFGGMGIQLPGMGTAPTSTTPPVVYGPQAHTGGVISELAYSRAMSPEWFIGAPRYHGGLVPELKPGEVPAILKDDEGVFTPEQMAALGRGAGGAGGPVVYVNVINESGQPLDAEQQSGRFDGEAYIVDVVVNAMTKSGRMRNAVKSVK